MNRDYPVNNKEDFVIELPSQVEWILKKLRDRGYEAFAVGGCVRDTILNRKPGDWDITTSARPEQVKAVFGKTVDTGLQHGTVTVIRDHVAMRLPPTGLTGSMRTDAIRRRWNLRQICGRICAAVILPSMPWPTAMRRGWWIFSGDWKI